MKLLATLSLLLLSLALFACADPNVREPQPQPIIPGDTLKSAS